jgi:hypothetical protein
MILAFKLSRRLLASVGFRGEEFCLADTRYIGPRSTFTRLSPYFRRLIEQAQPKAIFIYAPGPTGSAVDELLKVLEAEAAGMGILIRRLTKQDIYSAFGLLPLRTRQEMFAVMQQIWPAMPVAEGERGTPLAEAAAAALVGDLRDAWPTL